MLKTHEINFVRYTKRGEVTSTDRAIVPVAIPQDSISAIDVSHLTQEESTKTVEALVEYSEYYKNAIHRIFSFEDWLDHSGKKIEPPVKWRRFMLNGLEIIS